MPEPTKIPRPFADSGDKNSIPDSSGSIGFASWQEGFPAITSEPFSQGGVAPKRADFNGIFNALSAATVWNQQGGVYAYDNTTDYEVGNVVLYSGSLYKCITANGPSSAVKAPTDATVWDAIATASRYLPLSGGTLSGNLNFSTISTYIEKTNTNGTLALYAGNNIGTGAEIVLYGKDYSSTPGEFQIRAKDGVHSAVLRGYPTGALTWGGKNVERVSTSSIATDGYVKYESGLQLCWGVVTAKTTPVAYTFSRAFAYTPRVLSGTKGLVNTNVAIAKAGNISTTGFTPILVSNGAFIEGTYDYLAIGQGA